MTQVDWNRLHINIPNLQILKSKFFSITLRNQFWTEIPLFFMCVCVWAGGGGGGLTAPLSGYPLYGWGLKRGLTAPLSGYPLCVGAKMGAHSTPVAVASFGYSNM